MQCCPRGYILSSVWFGCSSVGLACGVVFRLSSPCVNVYKQKLPDDIIITANIRFIYSFSDSLTGLYAYQLINGYFVHSMSAL